MKRLRRAVRSLGVRISGCPGRALRGAKAGAPTAKGRPAARGGLRRAGNSHAEGLCGQAAGYTTGQQAQPRNGPCDHREECDEEDCVRSRARALRVRMHWGEYSTAWRRNPTVAGVMPM